MSSVMDIRMKMVTDQRMMWYSSVLFGLDITLGESPYGTAHTDGTNIVIDPKFWDSLAMPNQIGLILHELRHITDLHKHRKGTRDAKLWNVACDHVINLDIVAAGFTLPLPSNQCCCDPRFKGMAAEEVYEVLIDEQSDEEPDIDDMDDGEDSEGGSGSEPSSIDDVKDLVIQATQRVEMAERQGQTVGVIPGDIKRLVNAWLNPVLPWDTVLRRYMSAKAKEDYSWQRPSRRYISQGMYMPSLYSDAMGAVHVFIDASGSVSEEMFAMQVGQIKWIHTNLRPSELRIITFDTAISSEYVFTPTQPLEVDFRGGGGTDVTAIVEYMEKNPCEVNLVFTDGYFIKRDLSAAAKQGDVLALIYNNPEFTWDHAEVVLLPKL